MSFSSRLPSRRGWDPVPSAPPSLSAPLGIRAARRDPVPIPASRTAWCYLSAAPPSVWTDLDRRLRERTRRMAESPSPRPTPIPAFAPCRKEGGARVAAAAVGSWPRIPHCVRPWWWQLEGSGYNWLLCLSYVITRKPGPSANFGYGNRVPFSTRILDSGSATLRSGKEFSNWKWRPAEPPTSTIVPDDSQGVP